MYHDRIAEELANLFNRQAFGLANSSNLEPKQVECLARTSGMKK
jgi:hypothetical protein